MSKTKHDFWSRAINWQSSFMPINFNFATLGQSEIYYGRWALYPIYQNQILFLLRFTPGKDKKYIGKLIRINPKTKGAY